MATIEIPIERMARSPRRSVRYPANGEVTKRTSAKTEMTALASKVLTPNERANTGIAGARIPKPSATQNAMADRTATSAGKPANNGVRRIARRSRLDTWTDLTLPA